MSKTKYIFITGGVCSSLGKGIAASVVGALLETFNYCISIAKIDPYINIDAGTMNPTEHGEVYVTDDGFETDLDLGNYERFTQHQVNRRHSITTGQIYSSVIDRERQGEYLGKCVQMIPHITEEIKQRIFQTTTPTTKVAIIEVGGTVGDIESTIFLEAIRQFATEVGKQNVVFIHMALLLRTPGSKELKTKPIQHSVQKFREMMGSAPDILLCRAKNPISETMKEKLRLFTHVETIISAPNFRHSIYELSILYNEEGLTKAILNKLGLQSPHQDMSRWEGLINIIHHPRDTVHVAIIGKYTTLEDSYTSVYEALQHGCIANHTKLTTTWIDSQQLSKKNISSHLDQVDAIIVPGGFGHRGIEGKLIAIQYAREEKIPLLAICLGLQLTVVEYARNVLGLCEANSTEFDPATPYPVVRLLPEQGTIRDKGGTMRLGRCSIDILPNTLLSTIYHPRHTTVERHRHRFEIDLAYAPQLQRRGLTIAATARVNNTKLIEAVEWEEHPFGIGVQYHPEFTSKPFDPNPLFSAFIKAACKDHSS